MLAADQALDHCCDTRGPVAMVGVVETFEAALSTERVGLASVLTPSQANAQRAWQELSARTVSVNSIFRAPRSGADPDLLDAVTRTKVVHFS